MTINNAMNCIFRTLGVFSAIAVLAGCSAGYQKVNTFVEADDPVALTQEQEDEWNGVGEGLNAAWANPDFRYSRSVVPVPVEEETCRITAWKGERASAQIILWSGAAKDGVECRVSDFKGASVLPASIAQTRFVRYTLADQLTPRFMKSSHYRENETPAQITGDMLDTLTRFDMPARTARPVWVSIEVPRDAAAGTYKASVTVTYNGRGKQVLPLELEVVDHVLPTPDKWEYHLDLWQHPTSVARVHGVEVWSDEHFEVMRPVMKRLADAGQKVITATLNKDPWNHQCYDAYEAMIRWTRRKDGSWSYDYSVFDRWVQFMLDLGIDREINCYSMVPWKCELEYYDESKGSLVTVEAEPGTPVFPEIWTPFLKDFKKHLEEKGWLGFTNIAMDERSPEAMQAAADVLMACAPEMGFALADNHASYKKFTMMRDVCVALEQSVVSQEDIDMRRGKDFYTTFYICCCPSYPNTFSTSQPYESELLGWYNVAHDYDGMLRWAYNSWAADPQYDSRYGHWMSGDTYFVYPFNRSSVRFERLIDGIEVAEMVRQLRKEGVDITPLEKVLEKIRATEPTDYTQPWQQLISEARAALDEVSRK